MFTRLTKNWYRFHTLTLLAAGIATLAVPSAFAQNPAQLNVTSSSSTVPYNSNPTNVPSSAGDTGIPGPAGIIGTQDGALYYADQTGDYGGVYYIPAGSETPQPVIVDVPGDSTPTDIPYGRNLSQDLQGNLYFAAPFTPFVMVKIPNENGTINGNDAFDLAGPLDNATCNSEIVCTTDDAGLLVNNYGGINAVSPDPNTGLLYEITNICGTCQTVGVVLTENQGGTAFGEWQYEIPPQCTSTGCSNPQTFFDSVLDNRGNYYYTDQTYIYEGNINSSATPVKIGTGYPAPTGKQPPDRYVAVQGLALDANNNLWINTGHTACDCVVVFPFDPTAANASGVSGNMGNVVPANQYVSLTQVAGQYAIGFGPHNYAYDSEGYEPSGHIRQSVIGGLQFGNSPLGTGIFGDTAYYTFNVSETVGQIKAVTAGNATSNEFAIDSAPGTCTASTSKGSTTTYAAEKSCSVSLDYNPIYAGPRAGASILADVNGNALGINYLSAFGTGPQPALLPGAAAQLVATGAPVAGLALNNPSSVVIDGSNNIFIADTGNARVIEIPSGGTATVVATPGIQLSKPISLALDGAGNLYIADSGAVYTPAVTQTPGGIIQVTPQGGASYYATTNQLFYMSQATVTDTLSAPTAITFDNLGDLYLVNGDNAILRINPQMLATIVLPASTQFAGTSLKNASSIFTDDNSNFYIADSGNNRIAEFNELSSATSVLNAGTTVFNSPSGVVEDAAGNIYVTDQSGVTLLNPDGTATAFPIGSLSTMGATDLAITPAGDVVVVDGGQNSVVSLTVSTATLAFAEQSVGSTSSPQSVTVVNIGNAPLVLGTGTNPTIDAGDSNFQVANGTCTAGATIAPNASCTLAAVFTPQTGGPLAGTLTLAANTASGSIILNLQGVGATVAEFGITGLPAQAPQGGVVNFTVTAEDASGNPLNGYTGTVHFTSSDGAANLPANYTFTTADNSSHQFQATFNTPGQQTITVTDTTTGISTTSSQVLVQAAAAAIAVSAGNNQSAPLGQPFTTNLAALVTDSSSNPVTGALVTFTAPATGASGTFPTGGITAQAYTNSSGIATAPVFDANGTLGSYVVTASVSGVTQTAIFNLTNTLGVSTTSLKVAPASPSTYGQTVTFSATVGITGGSGGITGPTGSVTFNDGTAAIATVTLTQVTPANGTSVASLIVPSSTVNALTGGTHSFTATYSGDANYQTSTSAAVPYVISQATVTVSAPTSLPNGTQGQVYTIPVTIVGQYSGPGIALPGGSLSYTYQLNSGIASAPATVPVTNGQATITLPTTAGAGDYVFTIMYSGDANYEAQAAPPLSVTIVGFGFIPATTPVPPVALIPVLSSQTGIYAMDVVPEGAYGSTGTQTVTFSCTGLPQFASCTFQPGSLQFGANSGTTEVELDVSTVSPPFVSSSSQRNSGRGRILSAGVFWLPGLLLAGYLCFRRRRLPAWGRTALAALVLACGVLGLSACGGVHTDSKDGTYNFTINATGTTSANTSVTVSYPATLTITN